MAARSKWFERLRDIIQILEARENITLLDRNAFETLFEVKKRRALVLMKKLGARELGGVFTLDRELLLAHLRKLRKSRNFASFELEHETREQRIAEEIAEAKRMLPARQTAIQVAPIANLAVLGTLSPAIQVGERELRVEYRSFEEFCARLYELARALGNDVASFQKRIASAPVEQEPPEERRTAEFEILTEETTAA